MGCSEVPGLTGHERDLAEGIVRRLTRRAVHRPTLATLIDGWRREVEGAEAGYPGNFDDYAYGLSKRDLLGKVVSDAPEGVRPKIRHLLVPLDARFRRATRVDPTDAIGQHYRHGKAWWWERLPLNPGRLLAAKVQLDAADPAPDRSDRGSDG
jgi:hypothetical protein